ncbi:MAG: hypothetical protein N4A31_03320 [Rickettsiales bacterium]|jgi:hypothetical protein|nr:hypothetical protein [Rickettsiales bacterium]
MSTLSVIKPEFLINSKYTEGTQYAVSLYYSTECQGGLATWESDEEDGDGLGIYAVNMDYSGNFTSNHYRVNLNTTGDQVFWRNNGGSVSFNKNTDDAVFVWGTYPDGLSGGDSDNYASASIKARLFGQDHEVLVSENNDLPNRTPFVIYLNSAEKILVSWNEHGGKIYGQYLDYNGKKIDHNFIIGGNVYEGSDSDICKFTSGEYVVIWGTTDGISAVIRDSFSNNTSEETIIAGSGSYVSNLSCFPDNNFIITYKYGDNIYYKILSTDFSEAYPQTKINDISTEPHEPVVTTLDENNFMIAWQNVWTGTRSVYLKGYNIDGSIIIDEQRVSPDNTNSHYHIDVSNMGFGRFMIAYQDDGYDQSGASVVAKILEVDNIANNTTSRSEYCSSSADNNIAINSFCSPKFSNKIVNFNNAKGSQGCDKLIGNNNSNTILGGKGNDFIQGRGGADYLDGGEDIDTVSYEDSTAAVIIDLMEGTGQGGSAEGDTIYNMEIVIGSNHSDTIICNNDTMAVYGGTGDDTVMVSQLNMTVDGGAGDNTVSFENLDQGVYVDLAGEEFYELEN